MSKITLQDLLAHLQTIEDALRKQGVPVDEATDSEEDEGFKLLTNGDLSLSWGTGLFEEDGRQVGEIVIRLWKEGEDEGAAITGAENIEEVGEGVIYWALTESIPYGVDKVDGWRDTFFEDHVLKIWVAKFAERFLK